MPYGIGVCIFSHIFFPDPGSNPGFPCPEKIHKANAFAAVQAWKNPLRLYFMGYINPQNPDWKQDMDFCLSRGACGFKLWISLKDAAGSLERTIQVLRYAAQLDQCVYLHVFNRTGGTLPGEISMEEFAYLARTVPECRMIAGHAGGNWRKSAEIFPRCPENVWMEISGSDPDYGMVDGILKFCPPERLLYGSDAPGRAFFPQIWKVMESSLSPEDRAKVFFRNGMELLHLPLPPAITVPRIRAGEVPGPEDIDYCCFCGAYPFESRRKVSPEQLEQMLHPEGIREAYCAAFEAVFARGESLYRENMVFYHACKGFSHLRPLAAVRPDDPESGRILREVCRDPEGWGGLWLSPGFHLWRLDDPACKSFLMRCMDTHRNLFIHCNSYETRFHHPQLGSREVTEEELRFFLKESASSSNHVIIQGKDPFSGAEEFRHCSWCYTTLTDKGCMLDDLCSRNCFPPLVRGSQFPFRHLGESLAGARFRMRKKL